VSVGHIADSTADARPLQGPVLGTGEERQRQPIPNPIEYLQGALSDAVAVVLEERANHTADPPPLDRGVESGVDVDATAGLRGLDVGLQADPSEKLEDALHPGEFIGTASLRVQVQSEDSGRIGQRHRDAFSMAEVVHQDIHGERIVSPTTASLGLGLSPTTSRMELDVRTVSPAEQDEKFLGFGPIETSARIEL
jgi:hypothetical protein